MKTIFRFPFCDKLTVRVRNPFYTLVVIPIIQNKCSYKMRLFVHDCGYSFAA